MHVRFVAWNLLAAVLCAAAVASAAVADQASDDAWLAGGDPQRGQQVFASNGCGWCHEGSGRKVGRGPQLMDTKRTDGFLAERILNGKPGRMPAFGGNLDEDQIKDLVAFIHSLKPEAAP